jgi:hypothetical protein
MSYVIMNVGTESLYRAPREYAHKSYASQQGAKAMATRLNKQYGDTKQWIVMSREQFEHHYNPMVETKNLMSGETVMIRKSEKGGCCDPAMERYWSM